MLRRVCKEYKETFKGVFTFNKPEVFLSPYMANHNKCDNKFICGMGNND